MAYRGESIRVEFRFTPISRYTNDLTRNGQVKLETSLAIRAFNFN